MSKHKKFHSLSGKSKRVKAYAAYHRRYPYGSVPQDFPLKLKKAAPSAANTEGGRAEQNLTGTDSASHDTRETEGKQA